MISKDIEKFESEKKNIEAKNLELENFFNNKNLLGMIAMNVYLEHFQQVYSELKYLKNIANHDKAEELLFETYEGTLQVAGTSTRKFKDFTKENTDQFTRLKLRSIEERINKANNQQVEESKSEELVTQEQTLPIQDDSYG